MPDLIDTLIGLGRQQRVTRIGKVVSTSPFTVTLYGDTDAVAMPRLAAYSPTVNDRVLVLRDPGGSQVVLGKVIAADTSQAIDVPLID